MADTRTTHLNLIKQDPDTQPDVLKDHSNLETLDAEVWARAKSFNGTQVSDDGGFHVRTIPYAENFETSASQSSDDDFIIRTTGGEASLSDGGAWLTLLKGTYKHNGYVPQSIDMTVTPMAREQGQESISATIDDSVFVAYVSQSGTTTLTYSTAWSADPELYGITVIGTPIAGDVITVVYVKEVRGTIVQSNPQKFVSTGWNLYDHTNGYARVIKYSDTYGFKIAGTYTALEFASTVSGSRTTITPVSGYFTIPSDGYLFVTGGNATDTEIWMTWSDWGTSANAGVFAAYSESVIDLSTFMGTNFPYGLMAVGTVQDEINLNLGQAVSRVVRQAYNSTNLANAKASGRQYEYDENYIYIERETVVTYTVSVDGAYSAYDHGLEYFTGTEQEVYAQTLYGANLKNKLERDVLTISQQTLTSGEKSQVQANIGLVPTQATDIATAGYVADARAIASLNSKISPKYIIASTLSEVKSGLITLNGTLGNYTDTAIYFALASKEDVFGAYVSYIGILHRQDASNFVCQVSSRIGQNVTLGYSSGTWVINSPSDQINFDNGLTPITDANNAPYGFSQADPSSTQNIPPNTGRLLILTFHIFTDYYKAQIAIADNGAGIYYRNYDLGVSSWNAWKSVTLVNT